jgi:hypothetical protein
VHFTPQSARRAAAAAGFADVTIRHSVSSALFRKSLDLYVNHRLGIGPQLSRAARHVVAGPLCRVAGHLGFGGELLIDAVKA